MAFQKWEPFLKEVGLALLRIYLLWMMVEARLSPLLSFHVVRESTSLFVKLAILKPRPHVHFWLQSFSTEIR